VKLSRRNLQRSGGLAGAILVNAATPIAPRARRRRSAGHFQSGAKLLKLPRAQVLPASTGVIGVELDPPKSPMPCPSGRRLQPTVSRMPPRIMTRPGVQDRVRRSEIAPRRGAHCRHDQRSG